MPKLKAVKKRELSDDGGVVAGTRGSGGVGGWYGKGVRKSFCRDEAFAGPIGNGGFGGWGERDEFVSFSCSTR